MGIAESFPLCRGWQYAPTVQCLTCAEAAERSAEARFARIWFDSLATLAGALARIHAFYYVPAMNLTVETEHEEDGRWIAEVPARGPGLRQMRDEAIARAEALALRVLADRLEHAEAGPDLVSVTFRAA
jgi:hypothetical protein